MTTTAAPTAPDLSPEARENLGTCVGCVHRTRSWPGPIEKHECTFLLGRGTVTDRAEAGDCPRGYFPEQKRAAAEAKQAKTAAVTVRGRAVAAAATGYTVGPWDNGKGAALWGELHRWALGGPAEADGRKWLGKFVSRLPCGECARHFSDWLAANPCPWGPAAWPWSVEAHNAVNERTGKPPLSEADARRRWVELPATFRRVVVINLARRPDRWATFNEGLPPDWPFAKPERFDAIDGKALGLSGGGVAGCLNSHRAVLDAAVRDGVESILVMEDDCGFHPDFGNEVARFMAAVPDDWRGIWVGNQPAWWAPGDKGKPRPVVPGLVARTHWPHRLHCYGLRGEAIRAMRDCLLAASGHADHESGDYMGSRFPIYFPHPYAMVGQRGGFSDLMNKVMREDWFGIPPRRRQMMAAGTRAAEAVCFLPFWGEFGWMILNHIRHVHRHPAREKIVCCERGQECLFPTATGFFYDWKQALPDEQRCGAGGFFWIHGRNPEADASVLAELTRLFPNAEIIRPAYTDPAHDREGYWRTVGAVKFRPAVAAALPAVDVALCVRRRRQSPERDFAHWPDVAAALRQRGLRVGLVGARDTSFADIPAEACAWDHPDGPTAGTVDLLSRCRLYVGTDTGVTHLAALMDVPTLMFRTAAGNSPDLTNLVRRAHRGFFDKLPDAVWDRPGDLVSAALRALGSIETFLPEVRRLSVVSEDRLRTLFALARLASQVPGDLAELGVYKGGVSLMLAAACPGRTVYAFDTFQGIPNAGGGDGHANGDFSDADGAEAALVARGVSVHRGYFPDTAAQLLPDARFCFAHFDGDTYRSAADFLAYFWPRLSPGGVLVFDDYGAPQCSGVERATAEFFADKPERPAATARHQAAIIKSGEPEVSPAPPSSRVLPLRFYSQSGEDFWLASHRSLPARGVFVEVGAGEADLGSNTLAFEECGWRGVLVEPDPRLHARIRARRSAPLFTCAAGRGNGQASFTIDKPGLSGFLRQGPQKVTVEVRTLDSILVEAGIDAIDILSIDTEGTELEVWAGLDLARHRPRWVIVEWYTIGLPDRRSEITATVQAGGYRLIQDIGGNLIFEAPADANC